ESSASLRSDGPRHGPNCPSPSARDSPRHDRNTHWDERFGQLLAYKTKNSDCRVPNSWPENPGLSKWVTRQREFKNKGQLSKERANQLNAIGFDWNPLVAAWEENFQALEQYKTKHGDCNVPITWSENLVLAQWVLYQRSRRIKGQISKEQVNRLTTLGFEWDPIASAWEESFHALEKYRTKHGNCDVPNRWTKDPGLGRWVGTQRKRRINGQISKEQVNRLTTLGFEWGPFVSAWEENFYALKQYKAKHGDCNVPQEWPGNLGLGRWGSQQRVAMVKGKLSKERVNKLAAFGFDWDLLTSAWEESFRALEQYKAKHGDCNVPSGWPENPGLARWVARQRVIKIKGKLSEERANRLTMLGFKWHPSISAWEENFHTLEQYKIKHGDCNVPQVWAENPGLGKWSSEQRRSKIKGKLSKDRVNRLTAIGFEWRRRKGSR
ncbi:MAG: helicase associated domain-containing protein, partial [Elusimicrobiota bacterium]|nr:helicase associated domain-containing protein [Elusimicrobiota bacterium]